MAVERRCTSRVQCRGRFGGGYDIYACAADPVDTAASRETGTFSPNSPPTIPPCLRKASHVPEGTENSPGGWSGLRPRHCTPSLEKASERTRKESIRTSAPGSRQRRQHY